MESLDFSEEEIQQQLAALGYSNIPKQRLREFKRDLDQLIRHEKSKSHSSSEWTSPTSHSSKSPPALIKEKVQLNNIGPNYNYVLFNTSSAGQQREIFTSTFNEDDQGDSSMNHYYDSYSRHSFAHRPARPSTAPNRLETEEGPSEIFHSVLDGSETTSPDREHPAHLKPVIKRKVLSYLRMYKAFDSLSENESKDSSFWTDQESEGEDREYVKKENRRIGKEPERNSNDEKERFVMGDDKKERMKETLQGNELEKEKYVLAETNPEADEDGNEEERECFIEDEKEKSIKITRTDLEKKEEEVKGKENEEEEESEEEENELEEEEESEEEENELEEREESEEEENELEEEEESEAEKKEFEEEEIVKALKESHMEGKEGEEEEEQSEVEDKRKSEEKEESEEEKEASGEEEKEEESEEEEEGSRDEEEEFELCEQGERDKKKEEKDLEESEEEEDSDEEKESSVSGENTEENKAQINDSEGEKDQVSVEQSEEEESFPKEDSNSEEKCTGKDSDGDEKKESLTKEETTGGSGGEQQDEEEGEENEEGDHVCSVSEDNEGIEEKIDGGKSFVKKESTGNSESEGSENSKPNDREANNEEEMNDEEEQTDEEEERDFFAKDSTEENPDRDEEQERNGEEDGNGEEKQRECFINEYDKEIELGKSDEKEEDIGSDVDLAENRLGADELESEMEKETQQCKSGEENEEEEETGWFFDTPVEEKESCDQDRKSWASDDDDYVTVTSGHSRKEEEDNYNMLPAWEEEHADVRLKKETRDLFVEDFHESLGSPAASILTSGYGTYRPDSSKDGDPEEVDYRDDCTLAGLEEESESILDARDYDDNSSLVWFRDNQALETSDGRALAESLDDRQDIATKHCSDLSRDDSEDDGHPFPDIPSKDHQADQQQTPMENDSETQDAGSQNVAYFNDDWEVEALRDSLDHPFNLRHRRGRVQRRPEEKQYDDGYNDCTKKRVRAYSGCLGTVSELEERLDHMRIGASRVQYDSESDETGSYSDRSSSVTEERPSAFREYIKGMILFTVIRPNFDHPHTRNLKKTDPVAKYFQYKQDWETFKPPGEKSRKELHWAIREQLMYQPPPPRPQKTYFPNSYVVPTEKKRSALRWEIRHDLAHGIIPTKISYP
ncbi:Hydrolethalus syndrome protein 1 [Anabarilius grahami]|uniref:Hydrolethalus syndrome protein 1 n=1 Tax=Anabarilius grahami TaxID=495550 RepID=A0A3N0YFZ3_ANAGA|nr:Hydrolethalus syndrome protein 1 [Anabarilius grahami]